MNVVTRSRRFVIPFLKIRNSLVGLIEISYQEVSSLLTKDKFDVRSKEKLKKITPENSDEVISKKIGIKILNNIFTTDVLPSVKNLKE
jgi:hypothetical protein